jgi:hypothetical protein
VKKHFSIGDDDLTWEEYWELREELDNAGLSQPFGFGVGKPKKAAARPVLPVDPPEEHAELEAMRLGRRATVQAIVQAMFETADPGTVPVLDATNEDRLIIRSIDGEDLYMLEVEIRSIPVGLRRLPGYPKPVRDTPAWQFSSAPRAHPGSTASNGRRSKSASKKPAKPTRVRVGQ